MVGVCAGVGHDLKRRHEKALAARRALRRKPLTYHLVGKVYFTASKTMRYGPEAGLSFDGHYLPFVAFADLGTWFKLDVSHSRFPL